MLPCTPGYDPVTELGIATQDCLSTLPQIIDVSSSPIKAGRE